MVRAVVVLALVLVAACGAKEARPAAGSARANLPQDRKSVV